VTATSIAARMRAGISRPSSLLPSGDVGRRGMYLMVVAWIFLLEGIHALVRMLEDTMNEGSSWPVWSYVAIAATCFAAGGLLFTSRRWAFFVAIAAAAAAGFVFIPQPPVGGFAVFAVLELVFLALGFRAAGNPEAIQLASAGVPWRIKVSVVQVVIAIVLVRVFLAVEFDLTWIQEHWWNIVVKGLPLTLFMSVAAISLAIALALLGALARLSRNPVSYGVAGFYTSFFRGTPLIVQIFLIYFGLAEIGVRMRGTPLQAFGSVITLTPVIAGIVAIGLNYGAYMTEIFRAGIQSVGHGQAEAADALGMSYGLRMRRIVLPQAVRVIIPPTGNEFIAMTKDTALVFTIGALELFRRADLAGRADFRGLEAYIVAAAVYWILTGILTFFQSRLERKMGRGYVRTGDGGTKPTARKRSYLPVTADDEPPMTFIPGGHAGGRGGGAGGTIVVKEQDGSTRAYGIDGAWDPNDGEERP
jgi:polar amino acid transport system permease protein